MVIQATKLEKNLQTIYLMKDLYPEYTSIENSHNSIRKQATQLKQNGHFTKEGAQTAHTRDSFH